MNRTCVKPFTLGRALIAHALVAVLLVHSALAAVGATRAYGPMVDAFVSGVICSQSGDAPVDAGAPAPVKPSGYHCVLCALAQGGGGPATTAASVVVLPPARVAVFISLPAPHSFSAPRLMGWASSWSSRAPPFAA